MYHLGPVGTETVLGTPSLAPEHLRQMKMTTGLGTLRLDNWKAEMKDVRLAVVDHQEGLPVARREDYRRRSLVVGSLLDSLQSQGSPRRGGRHDCRSSARLLPPETSFRLLFVVCVSGVVISLASARRPEAECLMCCSSDSYYSSAR